MEEYIIVVIQVVVQKLGQSFVAVSSKKIAAMMKRCNKEEKKRLYSAQLCNAEVRKFSKHCRSCDKCVDGFYHHSRLSFECGVGIAVLVGCFVDKWAMEDQIADRLGDGFSRPPFAFVVAICTVVSFLATIPLGELFFFHIILIRKVSQHMSTLLP